MHRISFAVQLYRKTVHEGAGMDAAGFVLGLQIYGRGTWKETLIIMATVPNNGGSCVGTSEAGGSLPCCS
jgi:hypothetical protein